MSRRYSTRSHGVSEGQPLRSHGATARYFASLLRWLLKFLVHLAFFLLSEEDIADIIAEVQAPALAEDSSSGSEWSCVEDTAPAASKEAKQDRHASGHARESRFSRPRKAFWQARPRSVM